MLRVFLVALAAVISLIGAPSPAQAAAPSWDVAVLIYRSIDVNCNGRIVQGSLQQVEASPTTLAARFDSTTLAWSGMDPNVTVYEMGTLTSVTWTGSYCWPAPANVSLPAGFDSYIVLYDGDADDPATAINPYGGLAYEGTVGSGFTYATVPVPDGDEWWFPNNTNPELAMLHEWLHGVGGYYRATYGSQIPGLHSRDAYGYTDDAAWIRDFMGGKISGSLGITPSIWDDGPPGTVISEPEPSPSEKPCRNPTSNASACRP